MTDHYGRWVDYSSIWQRKNLVLVMPSSRAYGDRLMARGRDSKEDDTEWVLGGLQVYGAIRLRREIYFEWWLALGGGASMAFGIMLLLRPVENAVAALWVIAMYSVAWGVMLMLGGLSTRRRTPLTRAV